MISWQTAAHWPYVEAPFPFYLVFYDRGCPGRTELRCGRHGVCYPKVSIEGKRSQQGHMPVTIPGIPTTHKGDYDMQQWNATVASGLVAGVAMCNVFLRTSEIMFLYLKLASDENK